MPQSRAERKLRRRIDEAAQLFGAGDVDGAKKSLETLLAKSPTIFRHEVHHHLASIARELGDGKSAIAHLGRAAKLQPTDPETWLKLGIVNLESQSFEASADAFERLVQLVPNKAEPLVFLATTLQGNEKFAEAISVYEQALALEPNHPSAWTNLAGSFLQVGRWQDACDAANRQIALRPGYIGALALKSVALQELVLTDAWREIVNLDRLVGRFDITPDTAQFPDLQTFNHALADYCKGHPSLAYEPSNNMTTLGWQTLDLAHDDEKAVTVLLSCIEACVQQYLEARPVDPTHPYLCQRPAGWDYYLWGTVLGAQGHQVSHVHPDGWLSGVYYAAVPLSIDNDPKAKNRNGWIEFGRSQTYPKSKAVPETKTFEPIEGRLYLFPSHFYHRTISFESDEKRVSLAFDLMPRA